MYSYIGIYRYLMLAHIDMHSLLVQCWEERAMYKYTQINCQPYNQCYISECIGSEYYVQSSPERC
jgi:hypothetical protein